MNVCSFLSIEPTESEDELPTDDDEPYVSSEYKAKSRRKSERAEDRQKLQDQEATTWRELEESLVPYNPLDNGSQQDLPPGDSGAQNESQDAWQDNWYREEDLFDDMRDDNLRNNYMETEAVAAETQTEQQPAAEDQEPNEANIRPRRGAR